MRSYRFRLASVLRVRLAEEERARAALLRARAELRAALTARDAELHRYRMLRSSASPVTADRFREEEALAGLAAATLRAAEQAAGAAAEAAARSQVVHAEASRRVAALQRLDERRRREHEEAEQRAEAAAVDDIVTARHVPDGVGPATGRGRARV